MLFYIDDVLIVSHDHQKYVSQLGKIYYIKGKLLARQALILELKLRELIIVLVNRFTLLAELSVLAS